MVNMLYKSKGLFCPKSEVRIWQDIGELAVRIAMKDVVLNSLKICRVWYN